LQPDQRRCRSGTSPKSPTSQVAVRFAESKTRPLSFTDRRLQLGTFSSGSDGSATVPTPNGSSLRRRSLDPSRAGGTVPEEFEGDLAGAVFWGADLTGAQFRDVNLTNATISHAWLVNVDVDALIDRLVINGVDVTSHVNERDPWFPLRAMLRPSTPEEMQSTWALLGSEWATTIGYALALAKAAQHERVNEEFSFVQTVRHLVFAIDKWFTVPVLDEAFDPIGLPNTGSTSDSPGSTTRSRRRLPRPSPSVRTGAQNFEPSSQPSMRLTSNDRSRCSRTALTHWWSASTPSSKKSSGTSATPAATSTC
jgi:Pentapeptide repeats (8 copies)